MARFSMAEAENYGQQNAGSFFTLRDDRDTAKVRFLYDTIDDVEGYAVHQVELGDKRRYVNCLRNYNDPIDMCPLCKAQYKVLPKLFIKLYNVDTNECQIWERGKKFFERIAGIAARYTPMYNEIIEIERHGKKGDMQTTYEMYPIDNSPVNVNDFETTEPLGTIILDKNANEMEEFLSTGSFPDTATDVATNRQSDNWERESNRRTPSNPDGGRRAF